MSKRIDIAEKRIEELGKEIQRLNSYIDKLSDVIGKRINDLESIVSSNGIKIKLLLEELGYDIVEIPESVKIEKKKRNTVADGHLCNHCKNASPLSICPASKIDYTITDDGKVIMCSKYSGYKQ